MSSSCSESASSREPNTPPHSQDEEDEVPHTDDSVEAEDGGARVEDEVPPIEDGARVPISYLPLERTSEAKLTSADESRLRHNFDIPPEVHLHFKTLTETSPAARYVFLIGCLWPGFVSHFLL
jgi:hypothetical protein